MIEVFGIEGGLGVLRYRCGELLAMTALLVGGSVGVAPGANAQDEPSWNGEYSVTFFGTEKTGTSSAAQGAEGSPTFDYTFSSSCETNPCTATIVGGPPPSNPTVPVPIQYTWNGSEWELTNRWWWNCVKPDGAIEWVPASSTVTYTPLRNGTLDGSWLTTIESGACQGTVQMPLQAVPISNT